MYWNQVALKCTGCMQILCTRLKFPHEANRLNDFNIYEVSNERVGLLTCSCEIWRYFDKASSGSFHVRVSRVHTFLRHPLCYNKGLQLHNQYWELRFYLLRVVCRMWISPWALTCLPHITTESDSDQKTYNLFIADTITQWCGDIGFWLIDSVVIVAQAALKTKPWYHIESMRICGRAALLDWFVILLWARFAGFYAESDLAWSILAVVVI